MTSMKRQQQEIVAVLMAAVSGEATEEQLESVSQLILSDEVWAEFVLNVMSQEAWLTWHGSKVRTST